MNEEINFTLNELEKTDWGNPPYDSYLVTTCHRLRKKKLLEFTVEDLRIMIGQDISLTYLLPLALKELAKDILVSGDLYEGDLLSMVLKSDKMYWLKHLNEYKEMISLLKKNVKLIVEDESTPEIKNKISEAISRFKKYMNEIPNNENTAQDASLP